MDGAVADPDGDGMSNLQEYLYLQPPGWDNSNTASVLDNGVWWNGTIPVNDWNEEDAMQFNQPACGASGSRRNGNHHPLRRRPRWQHLHQRLRRRQGRVC